MIFANFEKLKNFLETPIEIVIIPHQNPDGDALGSTLALQLFLNKLDHQTSIVSPNDFPDFLKWMPKSDEIIIADKDFNSAYQAINKADLICTLDFNHFSRTPILSSLLQKSKSSFLMIDHHISPDNYAEFQYSDEHMSSTCEMVYNFISAFGEKKYFDKDIATCIYTGMLTDTGSFKYESATSTSLRIAAELIDLGADKTDIHRKLFDNNSFDRFKLLSCCFKNLEVIEEKKTAFTFISNEEKEKNNFKKGDTEGFVNYGLSIENVHFSTIFIENKEEQMVKISFRSVGDFDVNQFARKHFSGGGHKNAAGGKSLLSMEETVKRFREIINIEHP
ncbi:MAG: DHH family phosphoesterase [Flavobacteriaceae bacterium]|nr:DHH family phosphoesterase [Flavobacteriaceae bacterium]